MTLLPTVSILIPSYNSEKYIDQCIESALNQTYPQIEVILVDDCSTDATWERAQKYRNRVQLHRNEKNLGNLANHNGIFARCTGEYYIFLHCDDYLLPNFIENAVNLYLQEGNLSMVIGERMVAMEGEIPKPVAPFYNTSCIIPGVEQARVFMMSSMVLPCQVVGRSDCFRKIGGIKSMGDAQIWFEMALCGDVGYIQQPQMVYRQRNDNTTATMLCSLDHAISIYDAMMHILKIARRHEYLSEYCVEAEKNLARHYIRFAQRLFENKNYDMCRRYLALAVVFNVEAQVDHTYRTLMYCLDSMQISSDTLYEILKPTLKVGYERKFSYDPPKGYRKIIVGKDNESGKH